MKMKLIVVIMLLSLTAIVMTCEDGVIRYVDSSGRMNGQPVFTRSNDESSPVLKGTIVRATREKSDKYEESFYIKGEFKQDNSDEIFSFSGLFKLENNYLECELWNSCELYYENKAQTNVRGTFVVENWGIIVQYMDDKLTIKTNNNENYSYELKSPAQLNCDNMTSCTLTASSKFDGSLTFYFKYKINNSNDHQCILKLKLIFDEECYKAVRPIQFHKTEGVFHKDQISKDYPHFDHEKDIVFLTDSGSFPTNISIFDVISKFQNINYFDYLSQEKEERTTTTNFYNFEYKMYGDNYIFVGFFRANQDNEDIRIEKYPIWFKTDLPQCFDKLEYLLNECEYNEILHYNINTKAELGVLKLNFVLNEIKNIYDNERNIKKNHIKVNMMNFFRQNNENYILYTMIVIDRDNNKHTFYLHLYDKDVMICLNLFESITSLSKCDSEKNLFDFFSVDQNPKDVTISGTTGDVTLSADYSISKDSRSTKRIEETHAKPTDFGVIDLSKLDKGIFKYKTDTMEIPKEVYYHFYAIRDSEHVANKNMRIGIIYTEKNYKTTRRYNFFIKTTPECKKNLLERLDHYKTCVDRNFFVFENKLTSDFAFENSVSGKIPSIQFNSLRKGSGFSPTVFIMNFDLNEAKDFVTITGYDRIGRPYEFGLKLHLMTKFCEDRLLEFKNQLKIHNELPEKMKGILIYVLPNGNMSIGPVFTLEEVLKVGGKDRLIELYERVNVRKLSASGTTLAGTMIGKEYTAKELKVLTKKKFEKFVQRMREEKERILTSSTSDLNTSLAIHGASDYPIANKTPVYKKLVKKRRFIK
jgi:uncharacterized protein YqkB